MKFQHILKVSGILFLLGIAIISMAQNTAEKNTTQKPNVVLILMDDMGYGDLECYGGFPYHTPNINRLSSEGMRFTNFYVAQATCSASRSALLTGCYPNRIGINGALSPSSEIALNPDEETIASVLQDAGYKTAMVGKWHLGQKAPFLPLSYGFEAFTGLPYSHDYWPVNYDGFPLDTTTPRGKWPTLKLIEGNTPVKSINTLEDAATLTTLYTEKAVSFIKENKGNPFFLYVANSMPHVPLAVSGKFKNKSGEGLYGDVMEELDWSVGKILETLDTEGISQNTIVLLTSDNGPWLTYGNHAGNSGGFREGKGSAWEGGVRVPFIIRWPQNIKPASVCNKMAATMDILPTLAFICKAKQPSKKIDGVNIISLLKQEPGADPRTEFVYYYDRCHLKGIRKGQWKLVFPCISQTYKRVTAVGYDGWPGKYAQDSVGLALYNLRTDPGETLDVKVQFPDVVKELSSIANKYRNEIGDDLTGMKGNEVRPAALVKMK